MPVVEFDQYSLEILLLVSSLLLVISVLLSRISSSFGLPSLLLFLGLGMLAGSDGPGNIQFENYKLSFAVGSVCLAFIIFDGGLRTSWTAVHPILKVGTALSVLGTVITGLCTGIFAHFVLGLGWGEAFLLGAIVSSTDAAAVFGILRSKGLSLKGNLKQTLEYEAGSNDPVAVFLTVAALIFLTNPETGPGQYLGLFLQQAGLGLVMGWAGAKAFRWLINRAGVEFEGLYGVLMIGLVILLFSLTAYLGGSGFLAVYVGGIILGNLEYIHKSTIVRFVDGIAWVAQIIIFLVLGLLVFPTQLLGVWKEGLLVAFFMMFVARPISVMLSTPGSKMELNSRLFVSWIGLRGAAPIILATLPWSMGVPNAQYIFNLVFFVVLISVVFQGISIPWIANRLKVTEPLKEESATEGSSLLPNGFIVVEATVSETAPANGRMIVDLGLPSGVLLTSLERKGRYSVPQGNTELQAEDKVTGFARESNLEAIKEIFGDVKRV